MMTDEHFFSLLLQEGEGYKTEFKEKLSGLDREIVAFANSAGGSIFLGISDDNQIKGIALTNKLKNQVLDIARNCDPAIRVHLIAHTAVNVLEMRIDEGDDKPYRCTEGFFMRIGPTSQKLKRDEIVQLIQDSPKIHFDEAYNQLFRYPEDFSETAIQNFLKQCGIVTTLSYDDILQSLGVAKKVNNRLMLTNAGVLFFAKNPQQFYPEAYVTTVKYAGTDRFVILDSQHIYGDLITQIEQTMAFLMRHMSVAVEFSSIDRRRIDRYDYPPIALKEAVVNAIVHRDYSYDSSHTYIHCYQDRVDIENPGGLYHGLQLEHLGQRSVRRNRLIADLLHRAKYIEKIGSGFDRMKNALLENNNPPLDVSATNFFDVRFYKRIVVPTAHALSSRQLVLYSFIQDKKTLTKKEAAVLLNISEDTALRELNTLLSLACITKLGTGKSTVYTLRS